MADDVLDIYVFYGSSRGLTGAPSVIPNPVTSVRASLVGAGDLDGDGFADAALSWPASDGYSWSLCLYRGGPTGLPRVPSSTLRVNSTGVNPVVRPAGDVDGDGNADLLITGDSESAPGESVLVYRGSASGLVTTPASSLAVDQLRDYVGVDDVNGDGHDDVVLDTNWPEVIAFVPGASGGLAPTFQSLSWPVGEMAAAGDVGGDQYSDVLVGVGANNEARLYRGGPGGLGNVPSITFTAPAGVGVQFGVPVL